MKKGKTFVLNPLNERPGNALRIACKQTGHKRGPIGKGHECSVQGCFRTTLGGRLGLCSQGRTGRGLPLGQAVDRVVKEQIIDIHIPSRNVRQMTATDAETVPISSHSEHSESRVGHFYAR